MAEASEALLDPSSKVVDIKYDTRVDLAWENVRYSVATGKDTPDTVSGPPPPPSRVIIH